MGRRVWRLRKGIKVQAPVDVVQVHGHVRPSATVPGNFNLEESLGFCAGLSQDKRPSCARYQGRIRAQIWILNRPDHLGLRLNTRCRNCVTVQIDQLHQDIQRIGRLIVLVIGFYD